jgi:hypothetical protein
VQDATIIRIRSPQAEAARLEGLFHSAIDCKLRAGFG